VIDRFSNSRVEARCVELHTCERCSDVFATDVDLEFYVETFHEGSETCLFCEFRGNKMDLVAHISNDCGASEEMEEKDCEHEESCVKCSEEFSSVAGLQTRMENQHEEPVSCMFCELKGSKVNLIYHLSSSCELDQDKAQRVSEPKNIAC